MGLIKTTTVFMLISLFVIALVTFAVNFGLDNDAGINLGDDSSYESLAGDLEEETDTFFTYSGDSLDAYQESTISSQTEASEGGTQFKVTTSNSLDMVKKGISAAWYNIFRGDDFEVVLYALLGLLTFILAAYAYKAWVGRNPD